MTKTLYFIIIFSTVLGGLFSCKSKKNVDLIIYNANIYAVDSGFNNHSCLAILNGKIEAIGNKEDIFSHFDATVKRNLNGKTILPGLYDAHTHFYYYGLGLDEVDLIKAKSANDILNLTRNFAAKNANLKWIKGRGWDQNDWVIKTFPQNDSLNKWFPETPVFLQRIDGHAALVNQAALDIAGVTIDTKIAGGIIETKVVNGKKNMTGILVDNAVEFVLAKIPLPSKKAMQEALLKAQKKCFEVGLTSIADAGLNKNVVELIAEMQAQKVLKIRINAMLSLNQENLNYYLNKPPLFSNSLTICGFKVYGDGALGSRGACLLKPYKDRPKEIGFLLQSPDSLAYYATILAKSKYQMNTHCIGDSANRLLLNIYGNVLKGKNDRRWRIEHAQVINPNDFEKFETYNIIPSVQPTHATSDMYWVEQRLGKERVKTAYAYKTLIEKAGLIAGGSDFPVEDMNPFLGIYAAVARQDVKHIPVGGFEIENKISRQQALKAFTIWASYAGFEDKIKGSLEVGKLADFIIIDRDIINCNVYDIPKTKVLEMFLDGVQVK